LSVDIGTAPPQLADVQVPTIPDAATEKDDIKFWQELVNIGGDLAKSVKNPWRHLQRAIAFVCFLFPCWVAYEAYLVGYMPVEAETNAALGN